MKPYCPVVRVVRPRCWPWRHRSEWPSRWTRLPDQVEEDWQVVVANPDPVAVGPQSRPA